MPRSKSRPARWAEALEDARKAFAEVQSAAEHLQEALGALQAVKEEYDDWKESLPENLQDSALGEKLATITDLDFEHEVDLGDIETVLDEAEGAELPLGFGRD